MSEDISLLPDSFRVQEEKLKKGNIPEQASEEQVSMHIPQDEGEDIEIIEVDEGEVDQMLMNEPLYSRLYYKASLWFDAFKDQLFKPHAAEPPAKVPPHFFEPPVKPPLISFVKATATAPVIGIPAPVASKIVGQPMSQTSVPAPAPKQIPVQTSLPAKPKAKIIPSGATPRRVRIIKRVRKSLNVSFLDQQLMYEMQVNVPKRRFTLIFLTVLFVIVFTGSFFLLDNIQARASQEYGIANQNLNGLKDKTSVEQGKWLTFSDLEPRLMALNGLMDKHVSVSRVLDFLEKDTLSNVSLSNFGLDGAGKLSVSAQAPDLSSVARQLMVLRQAPELSSVQASSFNIDASKKKESVVFQLEMQFKPSAMLSASDPALQIDSEGSLKKD